MFCVFANHKQLHAAERLLVWVHSVGDVVSLSILYRENCLRDSTVFIKKKKTRRTTLVSDLPDCSRVFGNRLQTRNKSSTQNKGKSISTVWKFLANLRVAREICFKKIIGRNQLDVKILLKDGLQK